MATSNGVIYILTNPSFPEYVKIGYADDVDKRLKQLNNSECIPFAFRVYATYEVSARLTDMKVHTMIDKINPNLRSVENYNGKTRKREFYAMSPEDAYSIFEAMAEINGCPEKLRLYGLTEEEAKQEAEAKEIDEAAKSRAEAFRFAMCGIEIGDSVDYCNSRQPDISVSCKVVDDKQVEFNGETMSLTSVVRILSGVKNPAGPAYFKFKGEWLNDIRRRNGY